MSAHDFIGRVLERSGFGNGKGEVSFNKLVTFTALWFFAAAVYLILTQLRMVPPWYVWSFGLAVLCAGFGLKGLLGFLKQRTETLGVSATTTTTIDAAKVIDAIAARRDAARGVEPSP